MVLELHLNSKSRKKINHRSLNYQFMRSRRPFTIFLVLVISLTAFSLTSQAVVDLPGTNSGCPFLHDDQYSLDSLMDTLKFQLNTKLNHDAECTAEINSVYSSLSRLQEFTRKIDPVTRQKITKDILTNTIKSLQSEKLQMEIQDGTSTSEYSGIVNMLSSAKSTLAQNEIDLEVIQAQAKEDNEAFYREQLMGFAADAISAYAKTLRMNPKCVDSMGGWSQLLGGLMSSFSAVTSLGINPTGQLIGSALAATSQLITLLADARVRKAYNDLIRQQNYKTVA
jgi:hypothetical protein